jgi:hypothetical protein
MNAFYLMINGAQSGPHNSKEILALAKSGELRSEDLVRAVNKENWVPARNVKGLFSLPVNNKSLVTIQTKSNVSSKTRSELVPFKNNSIAQKSAKELTVVDADWEYVGKEVHKEGSFDKVLLITYATVCASILLGGVMYLGFAGMGKKTSPVISDFGKNNAPERQIANSNSGQSSTVPGLPTGSADPGFVSIPGTGIKNEVPVNNNAVLKNVDLVHQKKETIKVSVIRNTKNSWDSKDKKIMEENVRDYSQSISGFVEEQATSSRKTESFNSQINGTSIRGSTTTGSRQEDMALKMASYAEEENYQKSIAQLMWKHGALIDNPGKEFSRNYEVANIKVSRSGNEGLVHVIFFSKKKVDPSASFPAQVIFVDGRKMNVNLSPPNNEVDLSKPRGLSANNHKAHNPNELEVIFPLIDYPLVKSIVFEIEE